MEKSDRILNFESFYSDQTPIVFEHGGINDRARKLILGDKLGGRWCVKMETGSWDGRGLVGEAAYLWDAKCKATM